MQYNNNQNTLNVNKILAADLSETVITSDGEVVVDRNFPNLIEQRRKFFRINEPLVLMVINDEGNVLFPFSKEQQLRPNPNNPNDQNDLAYNEKMGQDILGVVLPEDITDTTVLTKRLKSIGKTYLVVEPVVLDEDNTIIGHVIVVQPEKRLVLGRDFFLLVIWLCSLAILGWVTIYILSKKLAKPIIQVAQAANEVKKGNYNVDIHPSIVKQKEIYDLVGSFTEMTKRLDQLEKLRTQLLASVTHELKTPIASISALIQSVKDEVVDGEEKAEFLDISLRETQRLQTMVEDLLDFNTFATGAITINAENMNLIPWIKETIHEWKVLHHSGMEVEMILFDEHLPVNIDSLRTKQILINLLQNSQQAMETGGKITVLVKSIMKNDQHYVSVDVRDQGCGIRVEEQPFIFERLYRGENKKHKVRGLGLGLALSKMIAEMQQGELVLKKSSSEGTTMTLLLPLVTDGEEGK